MGTPLGQEVVDAGYTFTTEIFGVIPNEGAAISTTITILIPGLGSSEDFDNISIEITGSDGIVVCESATMMKYGAVRCDTS